MLTRSWRGPAPGRPDLPLPPERMPLVRGGRPLKRWSYVGAYGPDLMLCAAKGRIGVIPFSWWAIWDGERLREGSGRLDVAIEGGAEIEVVSPHGSQYAWTRKYEARVRFEGHDLRGIVDQSAGYHARHTSWRWSAGVGALVSGEPVAWNLVEGIHDAPEASERTVWLAGEPREVPPVAFDDLRGVGGLRFEPVAVRAASENFLIVRSDYEQPFGTFTGELPGAGRLREGWGVMERHDVAW
jgi:hypothetical protein